VTSHEINVPPRSKSIGVKEFLTVTALSAHSIFEGLAIGLESKPDAVWQLFAGNSCKKFTMVSKQHRGL